MQPLGDKVLIKPLLSAEITTGGIVLLEMTRRKSARAVVVKVSPDITDEPILPKVGDEIIILSQAGSPVVFNNENLLMITLNEVEAIL